MIAETYKGIRPAPGYPACPDHLKTNYLEITNVEEGIGVTLTEYGNVARIISIRLLFGNPESNISDLER
jgi:5-methyltetrahydrofolate--homocysteine methyltransferase